MRKVLSSLLVLLFLSSCLKEEIPVSIPDPGELSTAQVGMEGDYKYQIYFNLEKNENVGQNFKTEWDLAFECSPEGWHIILNSSKLMRSASVENKSIGEIQDTNGLNNWKFDAVSGHLDSTAFGDWRDQNKVYIIDRGKNEKGKHQGFGKINIEMVDEGSYSIKFADLEEKGSKSLTINKDSELNFISFSFEEGGKVIAIEPEKDNWDLIFTQYTEILYDGSEYIPYLVTGVQMNRNQMMAALEEEKAFDEISLEDVVNYEFDTRIDQPGYDWKYFDFDNSVYSVISDKIYIIQSYNGRFYKLRFTDFYDNSGEKGYPTFEYQAL